MSISSGVLTTTASTTLTLPSSPSQENVAGIQISGTYAGVTAIFEESLDGTNFASVIGQRMDTGQPDGPMVSPPNNASVAWGFNLNPYVQKLRFRVTAIGSGSVSVQIGSTFMAGGLPPPVGGSGVGAGGSVIANSAQGAAAALAPALAVAAGKTNYITGFDVDGTGATAASAINVTITGLTNTLNFALAVPAGAAIDLGVSRLSIRFPQPIPASASNTAITLNVPSFGAGNTQASGTIYGFAQ